MKSFDIFPENSYEELQADDRSIMVPVESTEASIMVATPSPYSEIPKVAVPSRYVEIPKVEVPKDETRIN